MRLILLDVFPLVQVAHIQDLEMEIIEKALGLFVKYQGFPCDLTALRHTKDRRRLITVGYVQLLPHRTDQFLGRLAELDGETLLALRDPPATLTTGAWVNSREGFETTAYGKLALKASQLELETVFHLTHP